MVVSPSPQHLVAAPLELVVNRLGCRVITVFFETTTNRTILLPIRCMDALKQAGPSPQPRMFFFKSLSVRENIRTYSSNDLPHGTIWSSVKATADLPIPSDNLRHHLKTRAPISPFEDFGAFCGVCAKPSWVGTDANPSEVQAVGIPAGLDGDVSVSLAVGVTNAR
jgi:hypothetical protein